MLLKTFAVLKNEIRIKTRLCFYNINIWKKQSYTHIHKIIKKIDTHKNKRGPRDFWMQGSYPLLDYNTKVLEKPMKPPSSCSFVCNTVPWL